MQVLGFRFPILIIVPCAEALKCRALSLVNAADAGVNSSAKSNVSSVDVEKVES